MLFHFLLSGGWILKDSSSEELKTGKNADRVV